MKLCAERRVYKIIIMKNVFNYGFKAKIAMTMMLFSYLFFGGFLSPFAFPFPFYDVVWIFYAILGFDALYWFVKMAGLSVGC